MHQTPYSSNLTLVRNQQQQTYTNTCEQLIKDSYVPQNSYYQPIQATLSNYQIQF
jgi:hypothetical protein